MEKLKISKIVKNKPLDELSMEMLWKKVALLYKTDLSKIIRKGSFWGGFLIGQTVKMGKIEKRIVKRESLGKKGISKAAQQGDLF